MSVAAGASGLVRLDAFVVEQLLPSGLPLSPAWHAALASWPQPVVRARWAARWDAPAELLVGLAEDRDPRVRSAAVGNPALPLELAIRVAATCVPSGPLMVACRSDCSDELAAELVGAVGKLSRRRQLSWVAELEQRAPGLAGKPSAQDAALVAFRGMGLPVPSALVAVLEPALQERVLAEVLGRCPSEVAPSEVRRIVGALRGTPAQRRRLRGWLDGYDAALAISDRRLLTRQLPWWCDPSPVVETTEVFPLELLLLEVAAYCPVVELLELVAGGAAAWPAVLDVLAANSVVSDELLRSWVVDFSPEDLRLLVVDREVTGERTLRVVGELLAGPVGPVDVLALGPWRAREHPAELAVVLEPLLGSAAWPVLDALFDDGSSVPVAHLIVTACGIADVPPPDEAVRAAAALPMVATYA